MNRIPGPGQAAGLVAEPATGRPLTAFAAMPSLAAVRSRLSAVSRTGTGSAATRPAARAQEPR